MLVLLSTSHRKKNNWKCRQQNLHQSDSSRNNVEKKVQRTKTKSLIHQEKDYALIEWEVGKHAVLSGKALVNLS